MRLAVDDDAYCLVELATCKFALQVFHCFVSSFVWVMLMLYVRTATGCVSAIVQQQSRRVSVVFDDAIVSEVWLTWTPGRVLFTLSVYGWLYCISIVCMWSYTPHGHQLFWWSHWPVNHAALWLTVWATWLVNRLWDFLFVLHDCRMVAGASCLATAYSVSCCYCTWCLCQATIVHCRQYISMWDYSFNVTNFVHFMRLGVLYLNDGSAGIFCER